ncbi:hypothetical protein PQ455_14650 [Sphingomonas naphthae]|uniref:Uncharacterized protein n=1 Tax=Sphingomonas naphthae TaxID=1813468 RepID=A0ABY7TKF8_9SPHN|nr:hypothetical protein [Sphingomonas naphthae]WCT72865.1 hypothetical protein PQ455_14650 [Sphingomonas naphthae]
MSKPKVRPVCADEDAFARLKAELVAAFAAPESAYTFLDASMVIARNVCDYSEWKHVRPE